MPRIFFKLLLIVFGMMVQNGSSFAQKRVFSADLDALLQEVISLRKKGEDSTYVRKSLELYEISLKTPGQYEEGVVFRYYCKMLSHIGLYEVAIRQMNEYLPLQTAQISQLENLKLRQQLAVIYLKAERFEEAKNAYRNATIYNVEYERGFLSSSIANNIGFTCLKMNQLDSAEYYFQYAWDNNPRNFEGQVGFKVSLLYNMAQVKFAQNDFQGAKQKYLEGIKAVEGDKKKYDNYLQGRIGVLSCELKLGNFDLFELRLDSLKSILNDAEQPIQEKRLPSIYELEESYYLISGNQEKAYKARVEILQIENRIKHQNEQLTKFVLLELFRIASERSQESWKAKANELDASEDRIQILKSRNTLLWLTVFSFILFGTLSFIYLFKYFRKKREQVSTMEELVAQKSNLLETEKQLKNAMESEMKMKLQLKEKDLSNLALEINRKRQWMSELKEKLDHLPKEEKLKEVNKWMSDGSYLDKKQSYFTEMVEEVNEEFFHSLKTQFPTLSPKELELCGLIKLNLTIKEIAIFKQITPDSVKTARKRLRRKLNVEAGGDIYKFIQEF